MNTQILTDLVRGLVYATAELSLPLLLTALVVGLAISIFQAATQINEATLSFLPKVAAMVLVLGLLTPWMVRRMSDYTRNLYNKIPEITRAR